MSVIFVALSAAICFGCLIGTIYAAQRAARAAGSLRARLRSCESRIESLENSVGEWSKLTTDLANSVKMTKVRAMTRVSSSARRDDGLPDPNTDPEAWRKAMNLRIAERRLSGSNTN